MHLKKTTSQHRSKIGPTFCAQRKRITYYPTLAKRKHDIWFEVQEGASIEKQPTVTFSTGI